MHAILGKAEMTHFPPKITVRILCALNSCANKTQYYSTLIRPGLSDIEAGTTIAIPGRACQKVLPLIFLS